MEINYASRTYLSRRLYRRNPQRRPHHHVATSIAAFIDFFREGPLNKAVQIFGMADFEREFGGLDTRSEASYAVSQFFLNGGSEAWVIRTAHDGGGLNALATAGVTIKKGTIPAAVDIMTV